MPHSPDRLFRSGSPSSLPTTQASDERLRQSFYDAVNAPTSEVGSGIRRTWQTVDSPTLKKRLFIKRSATAEENFLGSNRAGLPENRRSRWKETMTNESLAITFVAENTTIPVPKIICTFEDRDCIYMIQEYEEGLIAANAVPADKYYIVIEQLEGFVRQLREFSRPNAQSFIGGHPMVPSRFSNLEEYLNGASYPVIPEGYVLCHGDLAAHNVLVDPETYQVKCVVDWEYASFLPREVLEIYPRPGPLYPFLPEDPQDRDAVINRLFQLATSRRLEVDPEDVEMEALPQRPVKTESLPVPDGVRWDKRILGTASTIETAFQPREETALQSDLRQMRIGHPRYTPITSRSLATQILLTTRSHCAQDVDRLATDSLEDYKASQVLLRDISWWTRNRWKTGGRRANIAKEYEHLFELGSVLPKIHRDLATELSQSSEQLWRLRSHFLERDSRLETWDQRQLPESRELADDVFRKMELIKWQGYLDAGFRFSQIAWAALHLLAQIPVDDGTIVDEPTPRFPEPIPNPIREHYEARIEDILAGGQGGWVPNIWDAVKQRKFVAGKHEEDPYDNDAASRFVIRDDQEPPKASLKSSVYPHPSQRKPREPTPQDFVWPPKDDDPQAGKQEPEYRPIRKVEIVAASEIRRPKPDAQPAPVAVRPLMRNVETNHPRALPDGFTRESPSSAGRQLSPGNMHRAPPPPPDDRVLPPRPFHDSPSGRDSPPQHAHHSPSGLMSPPQHAYDSPSGRVSPPQPVDDSPFPGPSPPNRPMMISPPSSLASHGWTPTSSMIVHPPPSPDYYTPRAESRPIDSSMRDRSSPSNERTINLEASLAVNRMSPLWLPDALPTGTGLGDHRQPPTVAVNMPPAASYSYPNAIPAPREPSSLHTVETPRSAHEGVLHEHTPTAQRQGSGSEQAISSAAASYGPDGVFSGAPLAPLIVSPAPTYRAKQASGRRAPTPEELQLREDRDLSPVPIDDARLPSPNFRVEPSLTDLISPVMLALPPSHNPSPNPSLYREPLIVVPFPSIEVRDNVPIPTVTTAVPVSVERTSPQTSLHDHAADSAPISRVVSPSAQQETAAPTASRSIRSSPLEHDQDGRRSRRPSSKGVIKKLGGRTVLVRSQSGGGGSGLSGGSGESRASGGGSVDGRGSLGSRFKRFIAAKK